jgi:anti-sigma regulatory factor (Ser/Thr protein kinase)
VWPSGDRDDDPTVYAVGTAARTWSELPMRVRKILLECRERARSSVLPVAGDGGVDRTTGVAVGLGDGVDGACWLEYRAPRQTTTDDTAVATALSAQLGLALHRARTYDQARTTSLTLQRAMLGADGALPLRFAVRYEPAVPPLEIGGDWYDVMPLPDDKIGVIVGDCVGSGLSAAAVMGQLRSSARALLSTGVGPARMLDQLDVACAGIPGARCTTVLAMVIDPRAGRLCYSSAGHVPALLAAPDAPVRWLDDAARSLPLATFFCAPRPEATLELPAGATLVSFTDGLVERRGAIIDDGISAVAEMLVDAHRHTPEDLADLVVNERRSGSGYDDDVAMVVYRQPPAPLRLEVPAEPQRLADVRIRLHTWLAAAGVDGMLAGDVVMAANEAATNSIEHGYRGASDGVVSVAADIDSDLLAVTVTDRGGWPADHEPAPSSPDSFRGRGIEMMRALVDSVTVEHDDSGTVVRMRTELARHR